MIKIPSLFKRDYEGDRLVINEVVPGSEWVINGEGIATRKWDGTACKVEGGMFYKRYDAKHGKTPPIGFIPAQEPDPITGHWPGWLIVGNGKEDRWFREGRQYLLDISGEEIADGTYELVGPKVNSNPEKLDHHTIVPHGIHTLNAPRAFDKLKEWFSNKDIEGIVWHHPDGRMVKIKKKDFGFKREMV